MIIRVFTEGQYEIPEAALPRLHELDAEAEGAVSAGESEHFHGSYERLLEHIRSEGEPLAADDLRPSDLILPPPDCTLVQAAKEFHGLGLIPE